MINVCVADKSGYMVVCSLFVCLCVCKGRYMCLREVLIEGCVEVNPESFSLELSVNFGGDSGGDAFAGIVTGAAVCYIVHFPVASNSASDGATLRYCCFFSVFFPL